MKTLKFLSLILLISTFTFVGCNKDDDPVNPADLEPLITGVTPSEGNIGSEIIISGNNFGEGATVMVGSETSTNVTVSSANSIKAIIPEGVPFNTLLPVTVKNTGGKQTAFADAFTALAGTPVVSSVSPSEGIIGTEISITGSNFDEGATVLVGGVVSSSVVVGSQTSITAIVPDGIEVNVLLPVTVRNPNNEEGTLTDAFLADHPVVESITPAEGSIGTEIAIKGSNFDATAKVFVDGIEVTTFEVTDANTIYALVPEGITTKSLVNVSVVNPNTGDGILTDAYTAIDPVLSYVNSATKPSGNLGSTVIIEGNAFGDIQGPSGKVLFSDAAGNPVEAVIASAEDWTDKFIVTTVPQDAEDGPITVVTSVGTSNELPFNVTQNAAFSPSDINWTETTSLPVAVSGHTAQFVPVDASGVEKQFVLVTGGKNSEPVALDQALSGEINADGTIASWVSTTALPNPLAYHKSVAATPYNSKVDGSGYLYVLGGVNTSDEVVNRVSFSPINTDGSLGTWNSTTSLPQPLHSFGVSIFRGAIYIAGGATTGNVPTDKVYKAVIQPDGKLGDWKELTSLPSARAYHGFVNFGPFLYAVGGDEGTVDPGTGDGSKLVNVDYIKINLRTGDLDNTAWTANANSLQKARSKHTLVAAGGNLFVSSGLYSAANTGSSENAYAVINSDGSVEAFAGATGSNTIQSVINANLFNQAGLSYIDANGVARIMIIGGDNLKNPGSKVNNVIFY